MNFIKNLGPTELIVIGIVLLLIFGKKRMSDVAKGLGESGRELKNVKKEFDEAIKGTDISTDKKPKKTAPRKKKSTKKGEEVKS